MESQRWDSISSRPNNPIHFIWTDTVENRMYVSGYTWNKFGAETFAHLAKYDGYVWRNIKKGLLGINGFDTNPCVVKTAYHYKNKILFGGFFWGGDTCRTAHLMYYDRTNFSKFYPEPFKLNVNSEVRTILEFQDTLYVAGYFDTIQNKKAWGLAKLVGSNWLPIDIGVTNKDMNVQLLKFRNELYLIGSFSNIDPSDGYHAILKWNNVNWVPVGGGIKGGGLNYATCAVVYKNELYIGGRFYKASGNAGHNIMRWNGTIWQDVGLTADTTGGEIYQMNVLNGYLYVNGSFTNIGSLRANSIARWDGNNWCSAVADEIKFQVNDVTLYNDKLVVCGTAIGSTNSLAQLRCDDLCSDTCKYKLPEYGPSIANEFSIYPNPNNGIFTINANGVIPSNTLLTIYNNIGQLVYKDVYTPNINLQNLASALYYIQINVNNKLYNYKIIKE